ncbi:N-fatty-acyl-amino acid synthase/hydrolase PM20D1.2-like [Polyodon spathula]|uniref:N-fatty-acyl-amino acid synthase/hydrolase PM20D1.2-like n=1 Tax=Polyodon spathula TaxID=7913 RepID=UPI001B7E0333|nr:N-fatty-acyl-amino acid synthase/hydrolase PM20D1.2-like [Polyodon spathula]
MTGRKSTTSRSTCNHVKVFRLVKLAGLGFLLIFLLLLVTALIRTLTFDTDAGLQLASWEKREQIPPHISQLERQQLIARFKDAIRIPTVSFSQTQFNTTALEEFRNFLLKAFPTVFSSALVKHEVVANYSHLFTVPGLEPDLQPYMLLAHIDVVPASQEGWDAPPFSAQEIDGFIYGRGTIDNKQSLMGILQALEYLLERGYRPRRTFYIGFGHDEEASGLQGAMNIVALLKSRAVKLSFLLDEGLAVMDGIIIGLQGPAALIGTSEKGQGSVKLSVSTETGHSSMPPSETSIGILAAAVSRLERNPMPRLFGLGPELATFEHLASKFSLPLRFVLTNLWLFSPLLSRVLERKPESNAFIRTTTAVTMFNAGIKLNVIPPYAEALVNFRIHSAQTLEEVLQIVRDTVADERVKVDLISGFDPLPVSSHSETSFGYQIIKKTVLELFPQVSVAPGICVGNTDSRHFVDLTKEIYRFTPTWFKPGDTRRFHGINERISVKNYEEVVMFYFRLFQNCDIGKLPEPHGSVHEL